LVVRVLQAARWSLLVLRIGIFQMWRQQTRVVFLPFRVAIVLMMVVSTILIWMHFFGAQPSSIRMTHGTATWITMTIYLWTISISRLAHNSISQGLRLLRFSGFRFLKLHKTPVWEVVYLLIYSPAVITGILELLKFFLFRVIIITDSLSMATKRINFPFGVGANWIRPSMIQINFPIYGKIYFPAYTKVVFAHKLNGWFAFHNSVTFN